MSEAKDSKTELSEKDDSAIYNQTNPSFHGTPEDDKNYKSLQDSHKGLNKTQQFCLKPSILTQKAEALRTDKAAVVNVSKNANKFLVLGKVTESEISPSLLSHDKDVDGGKNNGSSSGGFVFGENIFARVVQHSESKKEDTSVESTNETSSNGNKSSQPADEQQTTKQFEETEIVTGEENESNVLRLSGKLYQFNSDKNEWIEKGFCYVHLNDMIAEGDCVSQQKSRLVVRLKGCLKVIVNTFIWSEMALVRATSKSLRITAQTEDGIKSYLLRMTSVADTDSLFNQLFHRKSNLDSSGSAAKGGRKRDISVSSDDTSDIPVVKKRLHVSKDSDDDEEDNDDDAE